MSPSTGGDPEVVIAPSTDGGAYRNPGLSGDGRGIAVAQDGDVITTGIDAAGQASTRRSGRVGVQDSLVGFAADGHDLYALGTLAPDGQGNRTAILRRLDLAAGTSRDVQSFAFPVGDAACGGAGVTAIATPGGDISVLYGGCGTPVHEAVVRDDRLATSFPPVSYFGPTNPYRPAAATWVQDAPFGTVLAFTFTRQDSCPHGGPEVVFHGTFTDNELVDGGPLSC